MELPAVSIIFTNHNGGNNPIDCLKSIQKLNYPKNKLETIVVDNGSTDDSVSLIEKKFPGVLVLKQKRNLGFAGGINKGIKSSHGMYLFITNDDIIFEPNSLKNLVKCTLKNNKSGITGGKQVKYRSKTFLSSGKKINLFSGKQTNIIKTTKPTACDYVDGCTLLIPKKTINRLGGLDEGYYPAYGEDIDLCLRAKYLGYKILYCPQAVFIHKYAQTVSKLGIEQVYFIGFKNKFRLILIHGKISQIIFYTFFHFLIATPIKLIVNKEPILSAEIKSLIWNLKNINSTIEKRRQVQ